MYSSEIICLWHILDYSHKILLGLCIYIFGLITVILNFWLCYAFFTSRLLTFKSHLPLLSLCIASQTKCVLTGFVFFGSSALAGRWLFGTVTCQLFAFVRQILGVFQIMALVLIAIERFIITRPKRKGGELRLCFYVTGVICCWLISLLFSVPPLLGYGSYNCDVTGTTCDLDWRMLTPRQVGFNIFYLVCVGVLPVWVSFMCLWGANCSTFTTTGYSSFNQASFTKTMTIIITILYLFWLPQAILSLWIFLQNLHPPRGIPVALSVVAPISVEASEIIPVLCYLTYDFRLRTALLEICDNIKNCRKSQKSLKLFGVK